MAQIAQPESEIATPLVALVGNPNAGKTTLFNSLTGSHQKVGNYPGVTVEKVSGILNFDGERIECIDVPGLYSMSPVSTDEHVAVRVIRGEGLAKKPDALVCVINAANLERNLYFFSQLAEVGVPLVAVLTMGDIVALRGHNVDAERLSELIGCEVVPVVGHKGQGLEELRHAISRALKGGVCPPAKFYPALQAEVEPLYERLERGGIQASRGEIKCALQGHATELLQRVEQVPELAASFSEAREKIAIGEEVAASDDATLRYRWANEVIREVFSTKPKKPGAKSRTDRIDYILTHRVFGLIIFFGIMYLVFQSIYTFASPLMDTIDAGIGWVGERVGGWLEPVPGIQSLVVDGIIGGVGAVVIFLPQILILFFFIAVLEGTGYLARAAFLMDRLLGWCGLNGRAFIPLLSSFACAIPGIMSARVMPDSKSRLATILVAPLMSCSARLPVYIVLIGAFIEPQLGKAWAGFALFAMHFLGLLVAIPIVLLLNRGVLKGKRLPFVLELPPYQLPKWRDVYLSMYFRGKVFLQTAGTIIFTLSVAIWALLYFPRSDEAEQRYRAEFARQHIGIERTEAAEEAYVQGQQLADSYLGQFGRTIEPVFRPAGFDWRITTSILAAFPARELVVPSLMILFNLGSESEDESADLRDALGKATWPDGRPLMTPWTAVGLMVFFALCAQCMATLATVRRETNSWKTPVFMFTYMTGLAYLSAVGIHQLAKLLGFA